MLTDEQQTQRAATYSGGNRSVEYELTTVLNYSMLGLNDIPLLSDKIEVRKIYVHDGDNITGSDRSHPSPRRNAPRSGPGHARSPANADPGPLDELQREAEERAKAEAQAQEAARRQQDETPQQSPMEVPAN